MAKPDFTKIWAGSRPSIPEIAGGSYAAGWDTYLGPLPPLADDHDYVMNLQDEKSAWLAGVVDSVRIDVASASAVNLTTAAPDTRGIRITGTTTISGFTVIPGATYFVTFADALTLTNSASLVTQTGANILTAAGDTCIIRATAANVVEILSGRFLSERGIGAGQTWQDVTSIRANNTNYTNTTGRPIMVIVTDATIGAGSFTRITVDGLLISEFNFDQATGNEATTGSAIIPAGAIYSVSCQVGILRWSELR